MWLLPQDSWKSFVVLKSTQMEVSGKLVGGFPLLLEVTKILIHRKKKSWSLHQSLLIE